MSCMNNPIPEDTSRESKMVTSRWQKNPGTNTFVESKYWTPANWKDESEIAEKWNVPKDKHHYLSQSK